MQQHYFSQIVVSFTAVGNSSMKTSISYLMRMTLFWKLHGQKIEKTNKLIVSKYTKGYKHASQIRVITKLPNSEQSPKGK